MAKVTQAVITCDVCGNANDVQTRAFGFDGKKYEIDLCPEDGDGLGKVVAGYIPNARKVTSRGGQRRSGRGQRSPREAGASRVHPQKAKAAPKQAAGAGRAQPQKAKAAPKQAAGAGRSQSPRAKAAPKQAAGAGRSQSPRAKAAPKQAAKANGKQQQKGIYVYGILPADIEVATGVPGVGENPGPLRVIRSDGLAALISEVGLRGRLGSPEDVRAHREILDLTAIEVPVLPLRFGTVLTGEGAVTDELLTPRHDEFAAALEQLDGHAEFLVKGRYVRDEVAEISNETVTAKRQEDTRALRQAMEGICVASVVKEPAHDLDAVHVAFLVAIDEESEVERVIDDLAREWEGRIEVQLLGPMAAYDFVRSDGG